MKDWEYDILFFNARASIDKWIEKECELLNGQMNYLLSHLHYKLNKPL